MIKWIIYLLLLLNISFFVWHFNASDVYSEKEQAPTIAIEEGVLPLLLLSESQIRPSGEPAHEIKVKQWCYSVGPFLDKANAKQAAQRLMKSGIEGRLRISKEAKQKGYWVFLAPAKSRKEALQQIARLEQLKIKDFFLVATGEKANAVSLGVFSKPESAQRRIKHITDLGFTPQHKMVDLPRREYWIDWARDEGKNISLIELEALRKLEPAVTQIERTCL